MDSDGPLKGNRLPIIPRGQCAGLKQQIKWLPASRQYYTYIRIRLSVPARLRPDGLHCLLTRHSRSVSWWSVSQMTSPHNIELWSSGRVGCRCCLDRFVRCIQWFHLSVLYSATHIIGGWLISSLAQDQLICELDMLWRNTNHNIKNRQVQANSLQPLI